MKQCHLQAERIEQVEQSGPEEGGKETEGLLFG